MAVAGPPNCLELEITQRDPTLISTDSYTGHAKKGNPLEKLDIFGIIADIFTKFTEFTDEDSVHISCKLC